MGACKNDTIIIKAEGDDEERAINELASLLCAEY